MELSITKGGDTMYSDDEFKADMIEMLTPVVCLIIGVIGAVVLSTIRAM
jgi:hypothetical protein